MTTQDLVLLAYIVLIVPAMLVGFVFARRKMFEPYHKFTMTTITIVNWLLIIFVMFVTYRRDVIPQLPANIGMPGVLIPTLHLIPGLIAQLLATYLVIRMWFEKQLPETLKVKNIKRYMRTTLVLWLLTAVLGVLTWAVIDKGFLAGPAPVVTPLANTNSGSSTLIVKLTAGNKFSPASLTVPTGSTVQFINADTRTHTVTADDGSFDSGDLKPGAIYTQTFGQPGDVAYFCQYHGSTGGEGMAGVLHVVGKPVSVSTSAATSAPTTVPTQAPATTSASATSNATAAANAPSTITVSLEDNVFNPKTLTVSVGTTVHFVNNGTKKHTVTADDNSFDSGQMKHGDTFDQTFTKIGDVPLYCQNHGDKGGQGMSMVIHVTSSSSSAAAPTLAATNIAVATLDPQATDAINQLLVSANDTPKKTPYIVGMGTQMTLIATQGAAVTTALPQGHIEDAQAAAEAIVNIIEGGPGKDLDNNGTINQPGDGYGLKPYIFSINEQAGTIQSVTPANDVTNNAALAILSNGRATLKDIQNMENQAQALLKAKTLTDASNVAPLLTAAITKLQGDIALISQDSAGLPH